MQPRVQSKICIKGGHVWAGGMEPLREGGLLIQGDKILAMLAPNEVSEAALAADEVIDSAGMLLMPPLSNGHAHSSSTLFRGTENSLPLELWSNYIVNYDRTLSEEGLKVATLMTDMEMIRNGIGAYVDHYPQIDLGSIAIAAHAQSGIRVGFAPYFADLWDEDILEIPFERTVMNKLMPAAPKTAAAVEVSFRLLSRLVSEKAPRTVSLLLGPNSPQRCSDEMLGMWRHLQNELNIGSHTHLLETVPQTLAARRRWPDGMIAALDDMGLLHERLSVGHGIWLTEDEKRVFAARGVTISYNPISNAMLGSGRKDVRRDLDLGLRIALGTDCSNTGGRHDLFEVMRHMLFSGRDPGSDFERWISPQAVLISATQGAARVLGSDQALGTLAKGGPADVLILDIESGGMAASTMSFNSIVVHADPRNIHSLMIDGKWLLRDGVITTVEEVHVKDRAKTLAAEARAIAADMTDEIRDLHKPFGRWHHDLIAGSCCPTCGQGAASAEAVFSCRSA